MPHQQLQKAQDEDCYCLQIEKPDEKYPTMVFDIYNWKMLEPLERDKRIRAWQKFMQTDILIFLEDVLEVGQTAHMIFGSEQIYKHITILKDSESEFTVTQQGG